MLIVNTNKIPTTVHNGKKESENCFSPKSQKGKEIQLFHPLNRPSTAVPKQNYANFAGRHQMYPSLDYAKWGIRPKTRGEPMLTLPAGKFISRQVPKIHRISSWAKCGPPALYLMTNLKQTSGKNKENSEDKPRIPNPIMAGMNMTQQAWTRKYSVKMKAMPSFDKISNDRKSISNPNSMLLDDYEIGKQIGQGAYGVVKEAFNKNTNEKFAAKIYDKYRLLDPTRKKCVGREIFILKKIAHPNIVKLYETIDTQKQLLLILEFCKGKSLYSYLKSRDTKRFDEEEAKYILKQLVSAILYCHQHNISHRDIKMENILIDTKSSTIKIIDFGFASCAPHSEKLKTFCGTPSYMPPEIVNKQEYIGPYADMWSIGILMYTILCGQYPFKGENDRELYKKISSGIFSFPTFISHNARDLITNLLQVDPKKRFTCEQMANDKFFSISYTNNYNTINYSESNEILDNTNEILNKKYGKEIISKIVFFYIKFIKIVKLWV